MTNSSHHKGFKKPCFTTFFGYFAFQTLISQSTSLKGFGTCKTERGRITWDVKSHTL